MCVSQKKSKEETRNRASDKEEESKRREREEVIGTHFALARAKENLASGEPCA